MSIVVNPMNRVDEWMERFGDLLPDEDLRPWPEIGDPTEVEYVIAWSMPISALRTFTNLKAILSLGAGTEQWQMPGLPDVPVVRLADPTMATEMAGYTLAWVIRHQRGFVDCERSQQAGVWEIPAYTQPRQYRVGILGFGAIGSRIGRAFSDLDYGVSAWTRSVGSQASTTYFTGLDQLDAFLSASDAVINVLPATNETRGLLTAARLARFRPGSVFVNIGRGSVIADESDLIAALDNGPLSAAVLDVTDPEPPGPGSRLFTHPAVTLTAHLAGITDVESAARLVVENVARLSSGEAPFPVLDRSRGY